MTPERWQKIREVVEAAVELEPPERAHFLEELGAGDPDLRNEAESLLAAYDAGTNLDRPAVHLPNPHEQELSASDLLGQYQILERLGFGGMGAVYLARRNEADAEAQQVAIKVAIKVAHQGLAPQTWVRFRTEYRVLAELDHPAIAPKSSTPAPPTTAGHTSLWSTSMEH